MTDWIRRWFPWIGPPAPDRSQRVLVSGAPITDDHRELKPNGQQKDYVVLSEEERAKGFVRPVRRTYVHVGPPGPEFPLADLTEEQRRTFGDEWIKYERYPDGHHAKGHLWTQEQLDKIGKGCHVATTMSQAIAETYARDPSFYSGTFCVGCGKHLPVGERGEFVWDDGTRVGT
jgi:hypothetical protein